MVYCIVVLLKRFFAKKRDFGLPIISIGNIIIGGSGKTPLTIALCKGRSDVAIILRGYNRDSKGMIVVSDRGSIKCKVSVSGDEAMVFATSLPNAIVIVSEDREIAISKAKHMGAKEIYLDDGFSKAFIKKFDILIRPQKQPTNIFCIPSGGYREPKFMYSICDFVACEEVDFCKKVSIQNSSENMILITAISKPQRLDKYIPNIPKYYFADHHNYSKDEVQKIVDKHNATSILTTTKDYVKLKELGFECSILDLEIEVTKSMREKIENYIKGYK
jgi:tetraacyldisaccharide 4'-kinase